MRDKNILFPYLNGRDLNSSPEQKSSRYVINFWDWPLEKCEEEYPEIEAMNTGWKNVNWPEYCPQNNVEAVAGNLYRTLISKVNGHKPYEFWRPAVGDTILVLQRN